MFIVKVLFVEPDANANISAYCIPFVFFFFFLNSIYFYYK